MTAHDLGFGGGPVKASCYGSAAALIVAAGAALLAI
jgi:hypothetical protein